MYTVKRNVCECHPDTCSCNPWVVIDEDTGKKNSTHFDRTEAERVATTFNSKNLKTLVSTILGFSRQADAMGDNRTLNSILNHGMSELGETAIEVNIFQGAHGDNPGPDGVIGEAVDTILCMIDLIYKFDPTITEKQLVEIAKVKGTKWLNSVESRRK